MRIDIQLLFQLNLNNSSTLTKWMFRISFMLFCLAQMVLSQMIILKLKLYNFELNVHMYDWLCKWH